MENDFSKYNEAPSYKAHLLGLSHTYGKTDPFLCERLLKSDYDRAYFIGNTYPHLKRADRLKKPYVGIEKGAELYALTEEEWLFELWVRRRDLWDTVRNGRRIDLPFKPLKKNIYWWKCQKGHSFRSYDAIDCYVCTGEMIITGVNDLATTHPHLATEWSYEANEGKDDIQNSHYRQAKSVYWVCDYCESTYRARVKSKVTGEYYQKCDCYPKGSKGHSSFELDVTSVVKELVSCEVISNDRKTLGGKEIDILIPSFGIGIECNGEYWHSNEMVLKNNGVSAQEFHSMKRTRAEEKGVKLVFVWEYDWYRDRDAVTQEILTLIETGEISPMLSKLEGSFDTK